jgi:hypothetical protein
LLVAIIASEQKKQQGMILYYTFWLLPRVGLLALPFFYLQMEEAKLKKVSSIG